MSTLVRFLQFFTLGTWVGSILFFGAVVAPAAFTVLSSQDQAGALVGVSLGRLHLFGMLAGIVFLLAAAAGARSFTALVRPASLLVELMIVLTFISQHWVTGAMDALRARMGSIEATPATNPLRASFDRLHGISVGLEMAVLLCGIAALLLTSRKPAP